MDRELAKARATDVAAGLASSVVPGVGGALASLLAGEKLRKVEQDFAQRQDELARRIEEVEGASEALFSSPESRAALVKVVGQVGTEASEEKRKLLANALLNGFGGIESREELSASERDYFMKLVLAYEPGAIKALAHSIRFKQRGNRIYAERGWTSDAFVPSPHYLHRLEADGLVEISFDGLEPPPRDGPVSRKYLCTPMGWDFLKMVEPSYLADRPVVTDGQ